MTATFVVSVVLAVSPLRAEWQRASNKHFVIYADMAPGRLQQFADRLERFDAALRFMTKARESTPVTIYMVSDLEEVQRLSGGRNVGGYYRGSAQEPFVVVPLNTGPKHRWSMSAEDILLHEYAHHMLLSNNDQFLPTWANEGMAEFFMSAEFKDDGSIIMGAPNGSRYFSMTSMNRWTARQLLLSETKPVPSSQIDQRYSRGWLLVHYLLLSGERPNEYGQYIEKLNQGVPVEKAATDVFGDLEKLDRDLQRYLRRPRFRGLQLKAGQIKGMEKVTISHLTPAAAAIMPYRITSANGVNPDSARTLADKARPVAARYPNDAFVQRALAEMEYDAGRQDEAVAAAERAIAADPSNVMAMVYKGRVIARRAKAAGDPDLWKQARALFLRANRADPNHAMPFVSYYDSFVAAGQTPTEGAETGLLRSIVLVPQDQSLHIRVGLMRLRQNDLKGARTILGVAAFAPHTGEKNPARDAIKMMDEGAGAKEILDKVGGKLTFTEFDTPEEPAKEKPGDDQAKEKN
jgi:tetratricopeptide (TPR) repeat protein